MGVNLEVKVFCVFAGFGASAESVGFALEVELAGDRC